ncbi:MAG: deoxynucleoside kinase [Saprospiraceae bacterium]
MQQFNWKHSYVAIEGNIGAGKTTLCKKLSSDFNTRLILESFDENPFLSKFYENPEQHAFSVELFFMTERYKQLQQSLSPTDLFQQFTISDYFFIKTLLFAKQNLKDDEYHLFNNIFNILTTNFPKPDLIVYLHRPIEELLKNIKKRNRSYEQQISAEYLQTIQTAYFDYFKVENDIPILIIDVEGMDFIDNTNNYQHLIQLMIGDYKKGINRIMLD